MYAGGILIPSCTLNGSTADELSDAMAKSTTEKNLTININADIDMSTVTPWTPGTFNAGVYTINGNGHATGSTWTKVDVKNTRVIGNTINCTGTSDKKAGEAFGTIGAAGPEDNGKTGGVFIDAIIYGNTTTSNGTPIERIYGRFGNPGTLTINGGNYCDWENGKTEDQPDDGTLVIKDAAVFGHDKILSGAKDPTCVEDGYTGDTVCSACGDCFDEGEVIPKLTKHTYKDGKCSVCGAVDPNAPKAPAATDATAATGDDMNMALPIAVAGLALAAMAAVIATRRKHG